MPRAPQQSSHSSIEDRHWQIEVEDQIWDARDRSDSMKVEVEELKSLLGPEDSEVDFRRILEEARNKKGRAIFETFYSEGQSEFLVVSRGVGRESRREDY